MDHLQALGFTFPVPSFAGESKGEEIISVLANQHLAVIDVFPVTHSISTVVSRARVEGREEVSSCIRIVSYLMAGPLETDSITPAPFSPMSRAPAMECPSVT